LHSLAERSGQLVTKDELFAAAWPGVVVSDSALTVCIRELRRALGDKRRVPQFIETVHGRGYRFIAPVTEGIDDSPSVLRQAQHERVLSRVEAQHAAPLVSPALPLPDKPSIAVLPFVNMSGDPTQEYFSDGLTEVLTGDLSKISSLFVIARHSAFTYKGQAVKVQDIGRELGVRYVVEGGVLKAEDKVRITAQLIDATTGYHLWSERYDRPLQNLFALQDEVVQKIVMTLRLQLTLQEQGYIVRKHTDNMEAYDAFLRGIALFFRFTQEANAQARQMFEKAVALDPQYAEAYTWLGWTYAREWIFWSVDPQTLERALTLAQQTLALDDSLPEVHSLLSAVSAQKQQYDRALAEGERAIALDPNHADSYTIQAGTLILMGRPDEALRLVEQAMRLNPHYPAWYFHILSAAYHFTGRPTEAVATAKEFLSRNPGHLYGYLGLALSYLWQWYFQQGADAQTLAQALAAAQRAIALNNSHSNSHVILGAVYLWQKQYEPAMAEMERAIALDPNNAYGYAGLAQVLSRVGRLNRTTGDWHRGALADTSKVVRLCEYSARSFCDENNDSGSSPRRASPHPDRAAPCPVWLSAGLAHFAAVRRPTEPDRDCRRAVLFPLHRLSRGQGVSRRAGGGEGGGRGDRPGAPAPATDGALARAAAFGAGHSAQRAASVWVVSHAVELRHDCPGTPGAAGLGRLGRDHPALAACPGLGVEAGQTPRQG
jgi:TolB-like protein/cytochrome c-type biogenesis protein CcmH/NrfG